MFAGVFGISGPGLVLLFDGLFLLLPILIVWQLVSWAKRTRRDIDEIKAALRRLESRESK